MSIERFGIRISPLAGFAEGYGAELTQLGYAPASVRLQLKVLADLSDWLLSQGMAAAGKDCARDIPIKRREKGKGAFFKGEDGIAATELDPVFGGEVVNGGRIDTESANCII